MKIWHIYSKKEKAIVKYKFGEKVPQSIKEPYQIDKQTGTTGWKDDIEKEVTLLKDKFLCFDILKEGQKAPTNYQYIKLLWVFNVKYNGRKCAWLVAGGHMTEDIDKELHTSMMVELDTIRITFLAAKLIDL